MYKIVQDYIDALNELADERARTAGLLEDCDKKTCMEVRDSALELLNNIFAEYEWSEEFVTAYAVYCNFFVLNGLHKIFGDDFGLEKIYDRNEMDGEDRQYLEYIRYGIFDQDIEHFERALEMGLYNFDIPKLYVHILCFLEICSRDEEDFETEDGKEDILEWFGEMEVFKEEISGELKELTEPRHLSFEEEKRRAGDFSALLPEIIISSTLRKLSIAAYSDLESLSNLCGNKIESFQDILGGLAAMMHSEEGNQEKINYYIFFAEEFVRRTLSAGEMGDGELYDGKDIEGRNGTLIERREFLNLPVNLSERQYRSLAMAKQVKLNAEKDSMIRQNNKMVEDYSHSVENIMKPALIAEVAHCLREDEKNRELYRKIMYIYFNEVITQNECRLLKMVHNVSVSKGAIRENISRAKKKNSGNGITVKKIVYKAINQISLQLAENSQKTRFMFILEKMSQAGIDSAMIDRKLWDLSNEIETVYKMYSDQLNFELTVSKDLETIEWNEEEVGTSFLYTRIVEVISNALTYGDYGIDKMFHLKIYTDMEDNYIVIEMINGIGDRSFSGNREGNGLNATEIMLERINFDNPEKEGFVSASETEDGHFVTKMYIDADLYL